jgi:site-specific DNA recombinase
MPVSIKKAAIYARVSSEKQEREKTIESQLEELRKICQKDGVEIVKEYIDNGFSGSTLARPALDKLRDDASKGIFNTVYIHSPDRLARKYVYQAIVIEELRKKDIEIRFLNKPLGDSPEDQLLLGVQGLIAEYERAKLLERTRRGRFHKARNGNIMGGSAPYGYDYVKKTKDRGAYYKIDDEEANKVRLIFSLYLQHKSTARVVKELAKRQIKTRIGSIYWSKGTVHRILTNECYIGTTYYNKRDKGNGKCKTRDKSEWIPIKVPKIINDTTFKLAQKILKSHRKCGKRLRVYLLSGLIKCAHCGSNYIGLSSSGKNFYYRCGNFVKRFPLPKNCKAKPINALKIENAVINTIKNAISKPEILLNHIRDMAQRLNDKIKNTQKEKAKLQNSIKSLENKKKKLLDLYLEESLSKQEYLNKKAEIEAKEKGLKKKLEESIHDHPLPNTQMIIQGINHFTQIAKNRIEGLSPEKMHEFLTYLIDKITFDSHKMEAKITAHIPIGEDFNYQNLFHFPPALAGETRNKRVEFELHIKV